MQEPAPLLAASIGQVRPQAVVVMEPDLGGGDRREPEVLGEQLVGEWAELHGADASLPRRHDREPRRHRRLRTDHECDRRLLRPRWGGPGPDGLLSRRWRSAGGYRT